MGGKPRPSTEWVFDDLGRMRFAGVYDFTSAKWADEEFIGVVFAYTEGPSDRQDGEKRFQVSIPLSLARALVEALQTNLGAPPG